MSLWEGGEKMNISSVNNLYVGQSTIVNTNNLEENSFATMLFEAAGMNLTELELVIEEGGLSDNSEIAKYIVEDSEKKSIKYENMYMPILYFKPANIPVNKNSSEINNSEINTIEAEHHLNTPNSNVENLINILNFDRDRGINFKKDVRDYMLFNEDISGDIPEYIPKDIPGDMHRVSEKVPEAKYIKFPENQEINDVLIEKDEISNLNKIPGELAGRFPQFTTYMPTGNIITVSDESSKIKNILPQVKEKIIIMSDNFTEGEIKSITMQLQPQNLGKVSIKLTMEEDRLIVEIKSPNKETQKILSSNINELKEMLDKTSPVEIFVKPHGEYPQKYILNQGWQYEQTFYQGQGQNQGQNQGRDRHDNFKGKDKSKEFSELINFGIKEDMLGN